MKNLIFALSILSGTIIGVGFFSLPFITAKVGILVMAAYFLVLGTIVILVHLFFGEVVLKTEGIHRIPGYVKIHLGKLAGNFAILFTLIGFPGGLLAYLIIGGEFSRALFSPFFGGDNALYTTVYFILGAILIYFGIKTIAKIEIIGLIVFFIIISVFFVWGWPELNLNNLLNFDLRYLFLPYGPILFSLWGAALIPEAKEILGNSARSLKKIILVSIAIPAIIYFIFIVLVAGISGQNTSLEGIKGLIPFLGDKIVSLGLIFGIWATFTSYLALGLTFKKILWHDLNIPKNISWLIACFAPFILFLIGFKDFIGIISFVGGVMLSIEGILIILMYLAVKKFRRFSLPYFLTSFLIVIFILGMIYEITHFLFK